MCLGIPGKIIKIIDVEQHLGVVDVGGIQREVNLSCIVDAGENLNDHVGDWVLVHVGFAMSVIDEREAQQTLKVLTELGEMQEELAAMQMGES
ncbi:HypC/HybG/HupF family hydrogenase formation chaperone [Thalassomonas actiniarum]|uniref:HypC/HybG/HupF family hydrogenase formation chaperone n=1 Tax=Thalassomonas actiniarum TaxID=485447 RepID=A0AAE9YTJ6_9GAMM|nr:HypC/HybG/HupF family hydrogenase formation chaperone [Thalassomonas actiniarum]WDE00955.1 HypC/HybG/HupF family hydrogenase formation chaperone [Thalassomonas actiniarum]